MYLYDYRFQTIDNIPVTAMENKTFELYNLVEYGFNEHLTFFLLNCFLAISF